MYVEHLEFELEYWERQAALSPEQHVANWKSRNFPSIAQVLEREIVRELNPLQVLKPFLNYAGTMEGTVAFDGLPLGDEDRDEQGGDGEAPGIPS
jgi:hypothetical protein